MDIPKIIIYKQGKASVKLRITETLVEDGVKLQSDWIVCSRNVLTGFCPDDIIASQKIKYYRHCHEDRKTTTEDDAQVETKDGTE
jgi:hypothetical protein